MGKKKVLVIGGGGREHAIADALARSPQVGKIYCAPGNAGTAAIAENVAIKDTDVKALKEFAVSNGIELTVVGPEAALNAGIADEFKSAGLKIFGHSASATRIESSKEFAKELMFRYGIPTAAYRSFSDYREASEYVSSRPLPAVLKYDGLAAGKGVVVAETMEQADSALKDMLLDHSFGQGRVVVEDYLTGPEFSFMCFVSGRNVYPMPLAQDHKRAFDGDHGPNTGGMGAYTRLPFISEEDEEYALENILKKAACAMADEGCPLCGVLYGGLMKTDEGIKVIEFNARFGDPETEVVLPLLDSDIFDIFDSLAGGQDPSSPIVWSNEATMGVVLASKGYPGSYAKGFEISGTGDVSGKIYHMGTKTGDDGKLLTAGGRVMMCVAKAPSTALARLKVYEDVAKIHCSNLFHRNDIAKSSSTVLSGKVLSVKMKDEMKEQIVALEAKYGRRPSLAVVIVGEDPASQSYVRGKIKAAEYVGMDGKLIELPATISQDELLYTIADLNSDGSIDGILVQLPLPSHIDSNKIIEAISPEKDVDGFHPTNVANLWIGEPCIVPCTPSGIMKMIESTGVNPKGKTAVVVGRSNIVGKPVAKLLLDANATVILAHSRTADLGAVTRQADILVVAVGKAGLVNGDMVKPGAVVIDVGVNRGADGKLHGDCIYESVFPKASFVTPVPGGVGPMTITMLMSNTIECFIRRMHNC